MKTRIRRRIATATMVLASLGAGTTTAVLVSAGSAAPAGAAGGLTCSDPICVAIETMVFELGALVNALAGQT
ncbi:MAG TPA: hypothetical protein VGL48_12765 [Acidimicrobiales bacterium]|jgi:microcompartment protein CcmK/EutM